MFWLEGGIELLTPRWEPAILTTRPEGITLNVKDFRNVNTTRQKLKNFFGIMQDIIDIREDARGVAGVASATP